MTTNIIPRDEKISLRKAPNLTISSIYPFKNVFAFRDGRKLNLNDILSILLEREFISFIPDSNLYCISTTTSINSQKVKSLNNIRLKNYSSEKLFEFLIKNNYLSVIESNPRKFFKVNT